MIPEPWLSFLKEIDDSIESEVSFHCFGGFAITLQFGLTRETSDIDVMAAVARDQYKELFDLAGKDSPLNEKHKVYLDLVGAIAVVPDDYQERLIPIVSTPFKNVRLYVMEPHDIILAKLGRDHPKDIQDVEYLASVTELDTRLLKDRYQTELSHNVIGPPERMAGRLEYWIGVINERRASEA